MESIRQTSFGAVLTGEIADIVDGAADLLSKLVGEPLKPPYDGFNLRVRLEGFGGAARTRLSPSRAHPSSPAGSARRHVQRGHRTVLENTRTLVASIARYRVVLRRGHDRANPPSDRMRDGIGAMALPPSINTLATTINHRAGSHGVDQLDRDAAPLRWAATQTNAGRP